MESGRSAFIGTERTPRAEAWAGLSSRVSPVRCDGLISVLPKQVACSVSQSLTLPWITTCTCIASERRKGLRERSATVFQETFVSFLGVPRFFSGLFRSSKSIHYEELDTKLESFREREFSTNERLRIMVSARKCGPAGESGQSCRKTVVDSTLFRYLSCTLIVPPSIARANDGMETMPSGNPLRIPVGMHGSALL